MNTILALTAAGSCMTVSYLIVSRLGRPAKGIRRAWLIAAAVFYLVPLEGLREYYVWVWEKASGREWYFGTTYYDEITGFFEVRTEEAVHKSTVYQLDTLIYIVWFTVAALLLAYFSIQYFVRKHNLLKQCEEERAQEQLAALDEMRRERKIRRKVRLFYCEGIKPISVGVWRPTIILPEKMRGSVPAPILRHELTHIRNLDIPIKILMTFVISIHWFNPFCYLLKRQYGRLCELCCDDAAVEGCTAEERGRYAQTLVSESLAPDLKLKWTQYLSKNGRFVRERIENIMNGRKSCGRVRKVAGVAALVFSLAASSLTVFAYEDVHEVETEEVYLSQLSDGQVQNGDEIVSGRWFLFEDIEGKMYRSDIDKILYDEQFTDELGNIYEVHTGADAAPLINCVHNFTVGDYTRHVVYENGACRIEIYDAKRCGKCGLLVLGGRTQAITYEKCPH